MNNPDGPYPGRQLFLGLTLANGPCFAYLITGRAPESRERKAVLLGDVIRIGPVSTSQYDPLRHYAAVKFDNQSGTLAVSNGIQTEAIFETYKLLFNTASSPEKDYMEKILDGAGAEPDSYHTPRIAGIITVSNDKTPVYFAGIKAHNVPARAIRIEPEKGTMLGVSTYKGSLDNPEARDPASGLSTFEFKGNTADELARYIFDISSASYKGNDIRVCSIGGIRSASGTWDLAINNASKI